MASIIRDWVHKRVQQYKPFPTLNIETGINKEDLDSESDEEDRPDSGIGTPTTPIDDQNKQGPREDNKRPASPRTTDTLTKDAPVTLKSTAIRVTTPIKAKLVIMENKIARIKALPRIPKLEPPRRGLSSPNTEKKTRKHQEISPDRNGWDKKKQDLIGTP